MKPSRFSSRAFRSSVLVLAGLISGLSLTACDPIPGGVLTDAQKEADLAWMFTLFETNYAPMAYKTQRLGINFAKLEKEAIRRARLAKTNEEFYAVMQDFVANFEDAHTSIALTPSALPNRSRVAFAGFLVERKGDDFVVREILPIVDKDALPVKVGDKILEVNGKPVKEYIDKYITKFRNLGNVQSNYSLLANMIFFRDSLKLPIPEEQTIKLKIAPEDGTGMYSPKTANVEIPWSVRDYADFSVEMKAASPAEEKLKKGARKLIQMTDRKTGKTFSMAFLDPTGKIVSADKVLQVGAHKGDLSQSFRFVNPDHFTFDEKAIAKKVGSSAADRLKAERQIPKFANFVEEAKFFPSYIYPSNVVKNGKATGKKVFRGYIRIESFDPDPIIEGENVLSPDGPTIRKELQRTLATFQQYGVTEVFVDTVDNPGGSLALLLEVSQAFSNKPIDPLKMAVRLNENWMSDIERGALTAKSPQREVYQEALASMRKSLEAGETMSKPLSLDVIMPFQLQPNTDLKRPFKKLHILVNEGNASCGDIFPAIIQDNKLGTVIGKNTMGAGGNVVSYDQAPNSHATLRQTESLVIRKDGTYLENRGVKPDVEVDFGVEKKNVLAEAMEAVETKTASKIVTKTEFVHLPTLAECMKLLHLK